MVIIMEVCTASFFICGLVRIHKYLKNIKIIKQATYRTTQLNNDLIVQMQ